MMLRDALKALNDAAYAASRAASKASEITDDERALLREAAALSDKLFERVS